MKAQGMRELAESYGISISGTIHESLLELCSELFPEHLEKNFNRNNKKTQTFSLLFEDKKTKSLIRNYIDSRLDKFLKLCNEHGVAVCHSIERKIRCEDIRLHFNDKIISTILHFRKTLTGVHYSMNLKYGEDDAFSPFEKDISILCDMPGWLIVQNNLVRLDAVNANKLAPFLTKESIFIPAKNMMDFFEKFITDIIGRAEVETEGFDVVIYNALDHVRLQFTKDLFTGKWVGELHFRYKDKVFYPSDLSVKKTTINVNEQGDVLVFQVRRNAVQEQSWTNLFLDMGLHLNATKRLSGPDNDPYAVFHIIGASMPENNEQFSILLPEEDGKKILLAPFFQQMKAKQKTDWFELNGYFEIEGFRYPVSAFFQCIRENNRLFRLKNGMYWAIPETFMSSYKDIAMFGVPSDDAWNVSKMHYTLLENTNELQKEHIPEFQNPDVDFQPSEKMLAKLRPYQLEGAAWLYKHYKNGLGACLADDMGLGKTLQTLALLAVIKDEIKTEAESTEQAQAGQLDLFRHTTQHLLTPLRALIVLPASLVFNWYGEINKFVPSFHVCNHTGPGRHKDHRILNSYDIILTTYQTVLSDLQLLTKLEFRYVILDESQQIKNRHSQSFKALNSLNAAHKVSLSGTPVENSLSDLWSQMEFINQNVLGTYPFFRKHFLDPIEKHQDAVTLEKLKSLISPYILRRTKFQVAPDLPELSEQIFYSEMPAEHSKAYESEKSAARNYIAGLDRSDGGYKIHVFTMLMRLRLMASHPVLAEEKYSGGSGKFDDICHHIRNVVRSGQKVLVFSSFKKHLNLLASWLRDQDMSYLLLTGDTPSAERGRLVRAFQESEREQVFLISLKAGGVGLNLTSADYVFILDPWWNPFAEYQAISRAHRIGRDKPVHVIRFVAKGTIEEKILKLQSDKKAVSDQIIDVNEMPNWVERHLEDIIH
jgi:superfamily II DNA or RNA helicase